MEDEALLPHRESERLHRAQRCRGVDEASVSLSRARTARCLRPTENRDGRRHVGRAWSSRRAGCQHRDRRAAAGAPVVDHRPHRCPVRGQPSRGVGGGAVSMNGAWSAQRSHRHPSCRVGSVRRPAKRARAESRQMTTRGRRRSSRCRRPPGEVTRNSHARTVRPPARARHRFDYAHRRPDDGWIHPPSPRRYAVRGRRPRRDPGLGEDVRQVPRHRLVRDVQRRADAVVGTLAQVAPLGEHGSAHGRGPGDDAGVGGPACSSCGHVDRLIT
jgi:hypothetical protein